MKFIDEAEIYVKAGRGGRGCVSFRREKFVPKGGPDGGDGGKGGDVIIVGKKDLSTLADFRYKRLYRAENGKPGSSRNKKGRDGRDILISLPLGTIIYDKRYTNPIYDITIDGDTFVVARGGRGGRGNARFATPVHRAPLEFEEGEEGEERVLFLNLKLLSDIGIVGLPNAGKSTLISRLTNARPKIGDYPFTTLTPNLGVLSDENMNIVFSDIPGIVNGASMGRGLGLTFLKHIERSRALLFVLDVSSPTVWEDYVMLLDELSSYNKEILEKNRTVVLNKIDLVGDEESKRWVNFFAERGMEVIKISALKGDGIEGLKSYIKDKTLAIQKNSRV
ncbi:MAG TPA: GTPase ObgE [Syntrophorhabdaceae bacterium]|nr:GTPase ObgE [Syntrophorhabdaceae bacterium]HOL05757.1 GTPase ObgE [Syntrophorhabdaceae bacterium]HON85576.1 GTPase ObgE [Syntrophorhabdaceae bacterium]HOT42445.1 GTPase ObgE [Syntrophorhabdaceae bacterium]HPC66497.1 GTPase ObgE [Syntrophorhabdaceae bacterium]